MHVADVSDIYRDDIDAVEVLRVRILETEQRKRLYLSLSCPGLRT